MTLVPEVSGSLRGQRSADDPWRGRAYVATAEGVDAYNAALTGDQAHTLQRAAPPHGVPHLLAFDPTQVTHPENRSSCRGDTAALARSARPPHIAFNARQDPVFDHYHTGALDTDPSTQAVCVTGEHTHALTSVGSDASEDGTGRGTPIVVPGFGVDPGDGMLRPFSVEDAGRLLDENAARQSAAWRVRRLTPRECERLQGFPDDWTNVPGASDSARYAALGNSMAVPVMRWIGERIDFVDRLVKP